MGELPDRRTILRWLFAGRLVVAVVALLIAATVWTELPDVSFIISVVVILVFTVTVYGWWVIASREPGRVFLYLQALTDLGLITTLIHFSGGSRDALPALYILVVAAYAVLLPIRDSLAVALIASLLYLGDSVLARGFVPGVEFWAQLAVINVVFLVVVGLGRRLRKTAEERASLQSELRRVRLEADDILQNIRSGVLTVNGEGKLAFINPTAARLLRLDPEAVLGRPVLDLLKARCSEMHAAIISGMRQGRKVNRGEGWVVGEAGGLFPIGLSTTTFEHEPGEGTSVAAIFTDISDLKQLQEMRLRAERLEAVAALSASLAHEIRNPLASIRSSVELLARAPRADEDEKVLAGLIVRESDRLSRLLSEFLDFSRVRAAHYAPVDLFGVATAAVRLVKEHPDCPSGAVLEVKGQRTMIEGDEDLLHRVVSNLTLNAVQAVKGSGRITVSVGSADPSELPKGSNILLPVRLTVSDDGPGIPPEIRGRLFQPFVSGRAGGSGLGLAIVQRAVEAHRGLVLVDSTPGQGTTFTIYLPAALPVEDAA